MKRVWVRRQRRLMAQRGSARVRTVACAVLVVAGCAGLGLESVIQPPRFQQADGRQTELRLLAPSTSRPLGGASLRIWARVENPNAFGLTLGVLAGNLFLEGTRAADVNFPLGLPLLAGADTIIPLDVNLSFSDLPGLADVVQRAVTRNSVAYRVDGTIGVDAGPLGQPTLGPTTWLRGESVIVR